MQAASLGELLLAHKLVTPSQIANGLSLQKRNGSRLGTILIGEGAIGYRDLYQTLAMHHGIPFVDLLQEPPDTILLANSEEPYLTMQAIPWRRIDGTLYVAVTEPSEATRQWMEHTYGKNSAFVMTSPVDIRRTIERLFGTSMEKKSKLALWKKRPHASARVTLPRRQRNIAIGMVLMIGASALLLPLHTALAAIAFCHAAYGATLIFKCGIFAAGALSNPRKLPPVSEIDEQTLPVYSVLIPMYKEAASLPHMLESMQRMDYPASKLDIKLVLESDDHETLEAAYALKPRYMFDIIRVPPGTPRTKPRACNYALPFVRGTYLTIFDADDRPEKFQLKKAVQAFRSLPPDVICLQARLNYYNANDNLLTRFFSLEYTILFHFMLYGLEKTGIPIPLGGTSNHIALDRLRELGEWDPYNVTEDADLGTRLAASGWRTAMLDSYTMEEAPNRVMPWIRQRSRWIKGYMQTWLVHMRRPQELYSKLGWRGFIGFQFFIGLSCFTFLTAPLVWILSILWITNYAALRHVPFPDWLAWLTLGNLALNLLSHWVFTFHCALRYRRHAAPIALAALLYPLYLVLHTIASYRALWQLIVNPHFWDKTTHGLAKGGKTLFGDQDIVRFQHKSR